MDDVAQLITTLAQVRGWSVSYASLLSSGSGATAARLMAGHDITTRRAARIVRWCSEHWPEGQPWPEGIERPSPEAA
ncbi:MAG: hypothetical protein OXF68_16760 [Gammaproteobacteria bacterium]|nr:hypothetical protein [Gammaproteobacteria bacterium]